MLNSVSGGKFGLNERFDIQLCAVAVATTVLKALGDNSADIRSRAATTTSALFSLLKADADCHGEDSRSFDSTQQTLQKRLQLTPACLRSTSKIFYPHSRHCTCAARPTRNAHARRRFVAFFSHYSHALGLQASISQQLQVADKYVDEYNRVSGLSASKFISRDDLVASDGSPEAKAGELRVFDTLIMFSLSQARALDQCRPSTT